MTLVQLRYGPRHRGLSCTRTMSAGRWCRPAAVGRFAFALPKDKFAGHFNAIHELRDFCEEHRIKIEGRSWLRSDRRISMMLRIRVLVSRAPTRPGSSPGLRWQTNLLQGDHKLDFLSDGTGGSNPLRSTNESVRTAGPHGACPRSVPH